MSRVRAKSSTLQIVRGPARGRPRLHAEPAAGIQALETGIAILDAMIRHGRALTLGELSAITGLQPNKLHRYVVTFVRSGLMMQSVSTGFYDLGPMARMLGAAAFARFDLMASANQAIQDLANATGHTVCLYGWSELGPIMFGRHLGVHQVPMTLHVGTVLPISDTAIGQVFIKHLPQELTRPLLEKEAREAEADGRGPPKPAVLERSADGGRHTIYWCFAPVLPGCLVAAPIFTEQGALRCVVAIVMPRGHGRRDRAAIDAALRSCAGSLSEQSS